MTNLLTDLTAATELRLDFLNANRLVNTGPHSPARAMSIAVSVGCAADFLNSQGMERPDIPGPALQRGHDCEPQRQCRAGDGVGKVPNLFSDAEGSFEPGCLLVRPLTDASSNTGRLTRRVQIASREPAAPDEGNRDSFQHQPNTPQRRLAGSDAAAWRCAHAETCAGRHGPQPLWGTAKPISVLSHGQDCRISARPASLSFSWAAAASRACEPFEVSRCDWTAIPECVPSQLPPQSFRLVPA